MSCNRTTCRTDGVLKSDIKLAKLARAAGDKTVCEMACAVLEGILRKLCRELETEEKREQHHVC